jgi:hypothetical protein
MTKKQSTTETKQDSKMNNAKTISNVLLTLIALILGVIAFNISEANKEQKLAMKGLSTLVSKHYGHAMAVNLTNEGRRVASATHFANQTLPKENDGSYKYLLNHGMAGIEAYSALRGDQDIVQGAEMFAASSRAYGFQLDAATAFSKNLIAKTFYPEAEKIVSEIEAAGLSGEATEFGKALAIKTYSPAAEVSVSASNQKITFSMKWLNSLTLAEIEAIDFSQVDFSVFMRPLMKAEKETKIGLYDRGRALEAAFVTPNTEVNKEVQKNV